MNAEKANVIANNKVVDMKYTLKNNKGETIDASSDEEPFIFLIGANNIIKGLEDQLMGKKPGDAMDVVVKPEDGYGNHQAELIQEVPRDVFKDVEDLTVGMQFYAETPQGPVPVKITKVVDDIITIDANHELADEELHFSVNILSVRDATEQEIEHGHVHDGGHDH